MASVLVVGGVSLENKEVQGERGGVDHDEATEGREDGVRD